MDVIKLDGLPTFEETEKIKNGVIVTPVITNDDDDNLEDDNLEDEENKEPEVKKIEPAYNVDDDDDSGESKPASPDADVAGYVQGMIDLGLINTPEGFTIDKDFNEEKLRELLDYDAKFRDEQSQNALRAGIQDPKVFEIIDFAMKGGRFADVNKFFAVQNEEESFETLDITNEENAKNLILESYRRKGINPKRAKDMLDLIIVNDELETEAEELKKEFVQAAKETKIKMTQAAAESNRKQQELEEKWRGDFYKSLDERKYKSEKRNQIVNSFNSVKLQSGDTMPEWKYKFLVIQNNPQHFLEFLDILTAYNPEKGFEAIDKKAQEVSQTKVVNSLFDKVKQNAKGIKLGKGVTADESDELKPFVPSNPVDRNVRIK